MHSIKGIIFDMDGLLVDTEGFHVIAWKNLFKEKGIKVDDHIYLDYAGVADNLFLDDLRNKGYILPCWDSRALIAEKTQKLIRLAETQKVLLFPGAKETLESASRRFKVAVASNSERDFVVKVLENAGIAGFFRFVTSRNDVSRPKPEPDVYLKTAKKMGLAPCECVVFEDSEVGVESARRAGMICIAITTTSGPEKLKKADYIYENLSPCLIEEF